MRSLFEMYLTTANEITAIRVKMGIDSFTTFDLWKCSHTLQTDLKEYLKWILTQNRNRQLSFLEDIRNNLKIKSSCGFLACEEESKIVDGLSKNGFTMNDEGSSLIGLIRIVDFYFSYHIESNHNDLLSANEILKDLGYFWKKSNFS